MQSALPQQVERVETDSLRNWAKEIKSVMSMMESMPMRYNNPEKNTSDNIRNPKCTKTNSSCSDRSTKDSSRDWS